MNKKEEQSMFYMDCVDLIKLCIEKGLLKTQDSNIFVCRIINNKETWVLQDQESLAQELMYDKKGQKFLIDELKKYNINFIRKWEKRFNKFAI